MAEMSFQPSFSLAPEKLWQAINPWNWTFEGSQVGLINVNIGATKYPETERAILDEVGSYGRQLGRIGDALEVLIGHFDAQALSEAERDALTILEGDLAKIRRIKARERKKVQ
ncbi:hypothetical protein [Novosphingobium guangzhouense]|uniref:Uncharacterized protein n=1 Tax=Novosphingobium guangzhouense TaxID=1850347 RepID=A0A2K2FXT4_9SPHN|nr:hypothetical protein [Novosphingobium guangzhouense]PNU03570.1 hypothetical protein A8V01_23390 [Novosphingobium guangzhouense]